jgi:hypothetical protein
VADGFPYQSVDVYQNYVQNMNADSARFPMYFSADARVAKDVKLNSKYTLRPSISVTNITNHFNALEVHANTADLNMVSSSEIMTGTCVSTSTWFSK